MAKHFPLIFLAVLAGLCVWAIVRSIRQSLGKPPTWPEATQEQVREHFRVKAYWENPGPCGEALPVELEFPTLRTTLHINSEWKMRTKTHGYDWRPVTDPLFMNCVQTALLSE